MKKKANPVGSPLLFKTPSLLKQAIDAYFNNPPQVKRIWSKDGETYEDLPIYTVSGLSYHLGFKSRQTLYNYSDRPEYLDITKRAVLFIECEYERALRENNVTGAIFALKNMGWKDQHEVHQTIEERLTYTNLSNEELDKEIAKYEG